MDLRSRLVQELRRGSDDLPLNLDPTRLTRIVGRVLGVQDGGITLTGDTPRATLAATSPAARVAEELQTTLAPGPGETVVPCGRARHLTESELRRRWPSYQAQLAAQTPFRSVTPIPLRRGAGVVFAVLSLYSREPVPASDHPLDAVESEVADLLSMLLLLNLDRARLPDATLSGRCA